MISFLNKKSLNNQQSSRLLIPYITNKNIGHEDEYNKSQYNKELISQNSQLAIPNAQNNYGYLENEEIPKTFLQERKEQRLSDQKVFDSEVQQVITNSKRVKTAKQMVDERHGNFFF